MINTKQTIGLLVGVLLLSSCDIPKKPNFITSHKVEAPLLFNKEYQFLGGEGALLDTTKSDFDSLFTVKGDDHIVISIEEDFEIGDLDDAIPVVSVSPTSFNSQVGELEIGSFSSGNGNLGTASFQDLTGLDPNTVPSGTLILAGSTINPVVIDVGNNTDFFVSATVKNGGIVVSVTNNLGFDIDNIDLKLRSDATVVTTGSITSADHGTTASTTLAFSEGDVLSDLKIEVSISWSAQPMQADPDDLVVENIVGDNLTASQVEAALEPQDFSSTNTTSFDATDFDFGTDPSHYVELKSGSLDIDPINNGLDIDIESLVISFPGLRMAPYAEGDSLVIKYENADRIPRSATSQSKSIDLAGYRIFAPNNNIDYNISAITENTQLAPIGDQNRVINETDEINSSVAISNLVIKEALGTVKQQNVLLNTDENDDEIIDLFNEAEVQLTEISGLESLSKQLDGLEFTNPSLTINYESNIGIETAIYGVFLGVNANDKLVYLNGSNKDGTHEVASSDPISGLYANGIQIPAENMIKFELDKVTSGGVETGKITFNRTNSNVDEFLNNLPSKIRFIGKAVVNENEEVGTIGESFTFDPKISVDLPLTLTSSGATFRDTVDQDLSDFPSSENGDKSLITSGQIEIVYTNGLPMGFNIKLHFLDELGDLITSIPLTTDDPIDLTPSSIDPVTSFSSTPASGKMIIPLNSDQLLNLYKTRKMELNATLITTSVGGVNQSVKLRATDKIKLGVRANVTIESTIN
ncbi:MAG: hypothetical protein WC967_10235 [Balneolaceae bacterium]